MTKRKLLVKFFVLCGVFLPFQGHQASPIKTQVYCESNKMVVMVSLTSSSRDYQPFKLHLLNNSCTAITLNNMHARFAIPLTECGTIYKFVGTRIVFYNWLTIRHPDQSRSGLSRGSKYSVPVHCVYRKRDVMSLGLVKVFEPLELDSSRSSPLTIASLLGLPVNIKCLFTKGATPISVKLQKEGNTVIKVTGRLLQRDIVLASSRHFGRYRCLATDREGNTADHNVTIVQIYPKDLPKEGVGTTCTESSLHVTMNRTLYPWLKTSLFHVHLRDHACESWYINSTQIILKSSYSQCKTHKKESYSVIIYDNVFVAHLKPRSGVYLDAPDIEFEVKCRFKRQPLTRIRVTSVNNNTIRSFSDNAGDLYGVYQYGETLRLACIPDPYETLIGWTKNNVITTGSPVTLPKTSDKELVIQNLTDKDGGQYVCATTRKYLTSYVFVEVHLHSLTIQYIKRGDDGTIECYLSGFPKVLKTWYRNGKTLTSKGRYLITKNGNLRIFHARAADEGNYTCKAEQVFDIPASRVLSNRVKDFNIFLDIYDPLVIDSRKTSRKEVMTFQGLKTNLMCSFKHGALPLTITLTKNDHEVQSEVLAVRVDRRSLYALLDTRRTQSFGSYQCTATDAVGAKVAHKMKLKRIGTEDFTRNGITLHCNPNNMDVTFNLLAFPWLDTKNYHIHLNSSDCVPYETTTTHIKIKAPLKGCGTTFAQHSHVIIYYNNLVARLSQKLWPDLVITRIPDVEFPFKCAYERKVIMKQVFQIPVGPLTIDIPKSSPHRVSSLINIRVRLTCAFSSGAVPLTITMTKNGMPVAHARMINKRTLTAVLRADVVALGMYKCEAVDIAGQRATHRITLGLTEWRRMPKTGLHVHCYLSTIHVTLDRRIYTWLHPEFLSIHLIDQTCQPHYTNNTHVFMKVPLNGCGTHYMPRAHGPIVYQNKVIIGEKMSAWQVVSRSPVIVLPVECQH